MSEFRYEQGHRDLLKTSNCGPTKQLIQITCWDKDVQSLKFVIQDMVRNKIPWVVLSKKGFVSQKIMKNSRSFYKKRVAKLYAVFRLKEDSGKVE